MIESHPLLFRAALGCLGAALFVISVCRFKHMSKATTLKRVRHAAVAQMAGAAVLIMTATVRPDWLALAALWTPAAAVFWMAATSHAWRAHLPPSMSYGADVRQFVREVRWHDTVPADMESRRISRRG